MNRDDIVIKATSKGVQFIMSCIQGGINDYANPNYYSETARHDHSMSAKATCINCHIIQRAKMASIESQGIIRIKQSRGRTTFILADHTEIWYKKLNANGKPGFRTSDQALKYIKPPKQQLSLNVDMPPEKERWIAGYQSSSVTDTEFKIVVVGREVNGDWWEVPLTGTEIEELFPAHETVPAASTEAIKKRVHIRKGKEVKVTASESDA